MEALAGREEEIVVFLRKPARDLTASELRSLGYDPRFVFEERAAIREFDGGMSREDAERDARAES